MFPAPGPAPHRRPGTTPRPYPPRDRPQASAAASLLGSGNLARLARSAVSDDDDDATNSIPAHGMAAGREKLYDPSPHGTRIAQCVSSKRAHVVRGGVPFFFCFCCAWLVAVETTPLVVGSSGGGAGAPPRHVRGFVRTPWAWVRRGARPPVAARHAAAPAAIDPIDLSLARNDFVSPRTRRRHRDWGCARARRVPLLRRTNPARN